MLNDLELFVWYFRADRRNLKIDFLNFVAENSCHRSISRNIQKLKNWNYWLWRLSNWWFVIWWNSCDFIRDSRKIFSNRWWNQIMKCIDCRCNKTWMPDFLTWSMQSWCMFFLTIQFVCICHKTQWIWNVDYFSFYRISFWFCMPYSTEWVYMNQTESISEVTDLLMIELKVIDLIDSMKTVDSMIIDLEMIDSIERLIAAEKLLTELIRTYVDVTETVHTLIEKWFDVDPEIGFFNIIVHFRAMNCFWRHEDLDRGDSFNVFRVIDDLSFDAMTVWSLDPACSKRTRLRCLQRTNVLRLDQLIDRSSHQLMRRHRTAARCFVLLRFLNLFLKLMLIRWMFDFRIDCSNQK